MSGDGTEKVGIACQLLSPIQQMLQAALQTTDFLWVTWQLVRNVLSLCKSEASLHEAPSVFCRLPAWVWSVNCNIMIPLGARQHCRGITRVAAAGLYLAHKLVIQSTFGAYAYA